MSMSNNSSTQISGNESTSRPSCNWPVIAYTELTLENAPTLYAELICYPILLFICTIGNIITIVVLRTDAKCSTTNIYLICLALSDLIVLWLKLPPYLLTYRPSLRNDTVFQQNALNFEGCRHWLQETAIQFSDWTLIIFSLERLFAITRPLSARQMTASRVMLFELAILFLAAVCSLENLVDRYYFIAHDDGKSTKDEILPQSLRTWDQIQNEAEVVIIIGKWIILTVLNLALVTFITRNKIIRKSILSHHADLIPSPTATLASFLDATRRRSTHVLISCSVIYFLTQFPNVVYKILEIASNPPYCSYNLTEAASQRVLPIINVIFFSNYSVNFILYCLVWKKFREQLRCVFYRIIGNNGAPTSTASSTTNSPSSPKMSLVSMAGTPLMAAPLPPTAV
ncbi:hypothetical protein BV898_18695 [Hypsibius exemplaris]|uniref:G-protein coupled receptors family 1 profile domain-containing protein n=1 Tax=Hypsibius exemplaris TaxID=2072580 RepID=A0A9X6NI86_HYPEX|nr:hypothetical protein BV898_18695 [Hypsibius exemplaris]